MEKCGFGNTGTTCPLSAQIENTFLYFFGQEKVIVCNIIYTYPTTKHLLWTDALKSAMYVFLSHIAHAHQRDADKAVYILGTIKVMDKKLAVSCVNLFILKLFMTLCR